MAASTRQLSKVRLTGQQQKAAELLAENEFALKGEKKTFEQIAEEVGITSRQLYNWRKDPDFTNYMATVSATIFDSYTPLVEAQLIKNIMGTSNNGIGSNKAIEIFFRMAGRFVDRSEVTHTSSAITPLMSQDELRGKIADLAEKHVH